MSPSAYINIIPKIISIWLIFPRKSHSKTFILFSSYLCIFFFLLLQEKFFLYCLLFSCTSDCQNKLNMRSGKCKEAKVLLQRDFNLKFLTKHCVFNKRVINLMTFTVRYSSKMLMDLEIVDSFTWNDGS